MTQNTQLREGHRQIQRQADMPVSSYTTQVSSLLMVPISSWRVAPSTTPTTERAMNVTTHSHPTLLTGTQAPSGVEASHVGAPTRSV